MNTHPPLLLAQDRGATRVLTLNRPEKRNALNTALLEALHAALRLACEDAAVRTIVLAGSGPCFSAGRDQKEAPTSDIRLDDGSLEQASGLFTAVLRCLIDCPKPTIAAVHGYALAAGQALTLACDFVVAESNAQFGNPEMRLGFPAAMNAALLARHLGRRRAREIAITGSRFSADTYYRFGLVNRLVEPGKVQNECLSWAHELSELAPWAVRQTFQLFDAVECSGMESSLRAGDALNQLLFAATQLK
ncbi:MAG: enoyl-CoA hydratase/isomerase family protein [Pigmentiphaga sp.]|nr:enoyl-CoA hydratase/isomerase family protein [Pigmentiphaga sp.]